MQLGASNSKVQPPKSRDSYEFCKSYQSQQNEESSFLASYVNSSSINGLIRDYSKASTFACQAPKPEGQRRFWQMIWEKDVKQVFMLCNLSSDNTN
mmetsp:Transcript_15952/g.24701  ORF Transcript_15952/g.24701 Transcript_15952/m.24701 type:complete len:96 (-) Transcript_15952:743-1030(-)